MRTIDSAKLREMADELKQDAKALFHHNRPESMKLFRLFRKITQELHRRNNPILNN